MYVAFRTDVDVTVGAVSVPFKSVKWPSMKLETVPTYIDQSVTFTVTADCAPALPGLLPPTVMVKLVSDKPAVKGSG
ncbi:MAG: hypothetical protein EBZ36_12820 [Acidobacteria bacterium]|nr:hypothetical protein [Acidobacteriota bacterium]